MHGMVSPPQDVPAGNADGKGKQKQNWLSAVLLTLLAALVLWLYDGHMVSGLIRADAMDFAQLGRNLINGHGLTTYILRPLALTHGANAVAQPDVTHGPLYPFLLALAFGILGVKDSVVQIVSGLCFILTVPLMILLGQRLFNRSVGLLGAVVLLFNPAMLQYASEGSSVPLMMLLATCLFLTLDRVAVKSQSVGTDPAIKPPKAALVMTGILAGLLYLTEPFLFWILPILVVAVVRWHPHRRALATLWILLPLSLIVLPSMVRFGMLTGNPVFGIRGAEFWMTTKAYPGYTGYRMTPEDVDLGSGLFKSILLKIFLAVNSGMGALQSMPANCLLLFVVPGLFFRYGDRGVNKIRSVAIACLIGVFLGDAFLTFDGSLLMVVFPALLLYALAYLTHLLQEAKLNSLAVSLASTGMGAVLLFPLMASLLTTREPIVAQEVQVAHALQSRSRQDEVSLSDQPWIAAWYANRPSIWMPATDTRITSLRKQFPNARWLFLTPEARGLSQEWNVAFSGLMTWNQEYQQAQQAMQRPPMVLRISGQQFPLTEALDGFEAVPPIGTDTPAALLAVAPAFAGKSSARVGTGVVFAK